MLLMVTTRCVERQLQARLPSRCRAWVWAAGEDLSLGVLSVEAHSVAVRGPTYSGKLGVEAPVWAQRRKVSHFSYGASNTIIFSSNSTPCLSSCMRNRRACLHVFLLALSVHLSGGKLADLDSPQTRRPLLVADEHLYDRRPKRNETGSSRMQANSTSERRATHQPFINAEVLWQAPTR